MAAARYLDALQLAAEHLADPEAAANLDQNAVGRLNGLTGESAGGPLPWLAAVPAHIAVDRNWGPYLDAQSRLVARLAKSHTPVPTELIADLQVLHAATQEDPSDPRPTGPPQLNQAARSWQRQLDNRLVAADAQPGWQWQQLIATEVPSITGDPFLPAWQKDWQSHPSRLRRQPTRAIRGHRRTRSTPGTTVNPSLKPRYITTPNNAISGVRASLSH